MSMGRSAASWAPFALFPRHANSNLFRVGTKRSFSKPPEEVALNYNSAANATRRIQGFEEKFGDLPDYLKVFQMEETKRHQELGKELEDWAHPAEGEE